MGVFNPNTAFLGPGITETAFQPIDETPEQASQRREQELIQQLMNPTPPTPLPLPDLPGKGSTIAAGLVDAFSALAAGRAPRGGIKQTDVLGQFRQRRNERDQINRTNTAQANRSKQESTRAGLGLKIEQERGVQKGIQRKEEIESKRRFDEVFAMDSFDREADLRRELAEGNIDAAAELQKKRIAAQQSKGTPGDREEATERRQIRDGLVGENTDLANRIRAGEDVGTREEALRRFKRELVSFSTLTKEDRDYLLLDYMNEVDVLFDVEPQDSSGDGFSLGDLNPIPTGAGLGFQIAKDKIGEFLSPPSNEDRSAADRQFGNLAVRTNPMLNAAVTGAKALRSITSDIPADDPRRKPLSIEGGGKVRSQEEFQQRNRKSLSNLAALGKGAVAKARSVLSRVVSGDPSKAEDARAVLIEMSESSGRVPSAADLVEELKSRGLL